MKNETWLTFTDSEHQRYVEEWLFADDHLTGAVLRGSDRARMVDNMRGTQIRRGDEPFKGRRAPLDRTIEKYLLIRTMGETVEAYAERAALANYTPLFALSCISLAGMVRAAEKAGGEVVRTPLPGQEAGDLGTLGDTATTLGRMKNDCDGRGTNYETFLSLAGSELLAKKTVYVAVDGFLRGEDGEEIGLPRLTLIPPEAVLDKKEHDDTGRLAWIKVKTQQDTRQGPQEEETLEDRFCLWYPDRKETWRETKDKDGKKQAEQINVEYYVRPLIDDVGVTPAFSYYADDGRHFPTPPVFRVDLPLKINVGFLMAQYNNKIFNKESELDFQLRVASFPKFLADVVDEKGNVLKDLWNSVKEAFTEGSTLIPDRGGSKFESPPVDGIGVKQQRIESMIATYMKVFFQTYGMALVEQTATEVAYDVWSSVESFLTRFAEALDELENSAFFFLSQVAAPEKPDQWRRVTVDRSKLNFGALDVRGKLEKLIDKTQPSMQLPIDAASTTWLAERFLSQAGRTFTEQDRAALSAHIEGVVAAQTEPAPPAVEEVAPSPNGLPQ